MYISSRFHHPRKKKKKKKMSSLFVFMALMALTVPTNAIKSSSREEAKHAVELAIRALETAKNRAASANVDPKAAAAQGGGPWADCLQLYEDSEDRLRRLADGSGDEADALTWLSAALTAHATCVDGLRGEMRRKSSTTSAPAEWKREHEEVEALLREALAARARSRPPLPTILGQDHTENNATHWSSKSFEWELLELWNGSTTGRADMVVAQDGTGNHRTINEAVAALQRDHQRGDRRAVIYVKSGVYREYVEIDRNMRNVMFVGDGMDKTVVTGSRNVPDGYTTFRSATFGDGFWARDMTFENTAGPAKHQAVALRAGSDRSVFYRCSFKGHQDTLFVHSQRQYYRDCLVYGTVDFIFGNAAAVFQNCDILVRKPTGGQSTMITAQGRDDPNQNTGISIERSRVRPEQERGSLRNYLGRPWQKYSRTVFMKTDLDGMIHPEGWARWDGDFAVNTLYYGEYMNTGDGAATGRRVNWPGFHVMREASEAEPFTVANFLQGESWIPESGVPFWGQL